MASKFKIIAGAVAQASAITMVTAQMQPTAALGQEHFSIAEGHQDNSVEGYSFDTNQLLIESSPESFFLPSLNEKWTKKHQKRFDSLLLKRIVKNISLDERKELDRLTLLRRQKQPGRTADEIMRAARRQKLIVEMNELLRKYVKFSESDGRNKANWYPKKAQSETEGAAVPA